MRAIRAALIFLVLATCLAPQLAAASPSFERVLQEADEIRSSDPVKFRTLLERLEADKESADPSQRERHQYLRAYSKALYGKGIEEAMADAKQLFEQTDDVDLKFRAGSLLVAVYAVGRKFEESLSYLDQTIGLRHEVVRKDIRHDGIDNAAMVYAQLDQYHLSLKYAEETLADQPAPRANCIASHLRVVALHHLGNLRSDDAVNDVIRQCESVKEKLPANLTRFILARKWAAEGRMGEAIGLLQSHMAEVQAIGYMRAVGEMHSLLAELFLAVGDPGRAESEARLAISKSVAIPNSQPLVMAYKVLYEIAHKRGDSAAALTNYRKYAEADKAYINDVKAREMVYQIARQENAQKSQQIQLLNQQNEVLQLQQRVDRQARNNTRLVISLLVLLVGLISYWAYKVKRLHLSLRRFAETDALTAVSNRHFFTQRATQSLAAAEKTGETIALIMFDLDHFKVINDSYGHVTGDWALKQVAEACRGFCREMDLLGRVGGEEFAILLSGCDLRGATRLAEDTRVRISQIDTRGSGFHFSITASFGLSSTVLSGYELDQLMAHADLMLYRAKNEGRNRVRVYAAETPAPAQPRLVPQHRARATPAAAGMATPTPDQPPSDPLSEPLRRSVAAVDRMTG